MLPSAPRRERQVPKLPTCWNRPRVDTRKRASTSWPPLLERQRERVVRVNRYVDAYRQYCWPVRTISDLKLAPFHLLAGEGHVYTNKDHAWHMNTVGRLTSGSGESPLMATAHRIVDVTDPSEVDVGIGWWELLTGKGGEGMVVKPLDFVVRGSKGLVQPAVKCRGPEYLRIIYGPEYDAPENLERLRSRGLAAKRSLASTGWKSCHENQCSAKASFKTWARRTPALVSCCSTTGLAVAK
ncbi:MAG TPA: hypothetical protein VLJ39_13015 [Tepidisphaeraceae bacterium]|nr:hypothetical protein [Tepidisphaeraceae bacterium]